MRAEASVFNNPQQRRRCGPCLSPINHHATQTILRTSDSAHQRVRISYDEGSARKTSTVYPLLGGTIRLTFLSTST